MLRRRWQRFKPEAMDWSKAKTVLKTVAPVMAQALGGPLAGTAAAAISKAIFGDTPADESKVTEALLRADPATLLKLKEADHAFALEMGKLELDIERLAAEDRGSARARQAETRDPMPALIALAALVGFFGILTAMIFVDLPEKAEQPLGIMLGALGALVTSVGQFYFGSSAGSAEKTRLLAQLDKPR